MDVWQGPNYASEKLHGDRLYSTWACHTQALIYDIVQYLMSHIILYSDIVVLILA